MSSDKNKPSADRIALFKRLAKYSFEITDFERIREYGLELVGGWFSHNNQRCYLEFCTPPAYVKGNKQRINQLRAAGLASISTASKTRMAKPAMYLRQEKSWCWNRSEKGEY